MVFLTSFVHTKMHIFSDQSNWFWKLFDSKSSITMMIACICCETIKSSSYICARKNYPINFCSILSLFIFKISFSSSTKFQIILLYAWLKVFCNFIWMGVIFLPSNNYYYLAIKIHEAHDFIGVILDYISCLRNYHHHFRFCF